MSAFEITFNTDDPQLRPALAEMGRRPRDSTRLRFEAAICQWWANRCLEQAGAMDGRDQTERNRAARARATRKANHTTTPMNGASS